MGFYNKTAYKIGINWVTEDAITGCCFVRKLKLKFSFKLLFRFRKESEAFLLAKYAYTQFDFSRWYLYIKQIDMYSTVVVYIQ